MVGACPLSIAAKGSVTSQHFEWCFCFFVDCSVGPLCSQGVCCMHVLHACPGDDLGINYTIRVKRGWTSTLTCAAFVHFVRSDPCFPIESTCKKGHATINSAQKPAMYPSTQLRTGGAIRPGCYCDCNRIRVLINFSSSNVVWSQTLGGPCRRRVVLPTTIFDGLICKLVSFLGFMDCLQTERSHKQSSPEQAFGIAPQMSLRKHDCGKSAQACNALAIGRKVSCWRKELVLARLMNRQTAALGKRVPTDLAFEGTSIRNGYDGGLQLPL